MRAVVLAVRDCSSALVGRRGEGSKTDCQLSSPAAQEHGVTSELPESKEEEAGGRRWQLVTSGVSALAAVVATLARVFDVVGASGLGRAGALAMAVAALLAIGRAEVHRRDHYFGYRPNNRPEWTIRDRR